MTTKLRTPPASRLHLEAGAMARMRLRCARRPSGDAGMRPPPSAGSCLTWLITRSRLARHADVANRTSKAARHASRASRADAPVVPRRHLPSPVESTPARPARRPREHPQPSSRSGHSCAGSVSATRGSCASASPPTWRDRQRHGAAAPPPSPRLPHDVAPCISTMWLTMDRPIRAAVLARRPLVGLRKRSKTGAKKSGAMPAPCRHGYLDRD